MHCTARLSTTFVRATQPVLTLAESRLLLHSLRAIHTTDTNLPAFEVPLNLILERTNGNGRQLVHEAVRKLRVREFLDHTLYDELEVDDEANMVRGTFNPAQRIHLLYQAQVAGGGFAQVDLSATTFTSVHAYRFYWLLNTYKEGTRQHFELGELRRLLLGGEEKYTSWTDFKRYVLTLVQEQLAGAGIRLDYLESKQRGRVSGVTIVVPGFSARPRGAVRANPASITNPAGMESAISEEEQEFEQLCQKFPRYWNLYVRLNAHHHLTRAGAAWVVKWCGEKPGTRLKVVEDKLKTVVAQAAFKPIRNLRSYTET